MTEKLKKISFKDIHEDHLPNGEIVKLPGIILDINGRQPEINNGEGAIIIDLDQAILGNVMPDSWRLRSESAPPKVARNADIVPWSLKNNPLENIPEIIHPDIVSVGHEDEGNVICEDPFTFADATKIPTQAIDSSKYIKLTPELLIDAVELTGKAGYYGYEGILRAIQDGRKRLFVAALQIDQYPIFTGCEPLATNPPINPHPYLQRAGRTVAERYLSLDKNSQYYRTFVSHILGVNWEPHSDEMLLAGLSQFRANGYQTNINIPEDNEILAVGVGNYLTFSKVSLMMGSLLNSSPAVAGILTPWSDARFFVKRVLKSAGPQDLFQQPQGNALYRVNQQIVNGYVPTIARGMCFGTNGQSTFHGLSRIRGDRGPENSTWEDMIPSPSHESLQAAYSYLKTCQAVYFIYCMKNKITPDHRYHEIPPIEKREKLLIQSAMYGTSIFKSELIDYLRFMYDFLDSKNILSQGFLETQRVISDCLTEPAEYGINHYLDPQSPSYQIGSLSEHLRASIEENALRMGINVQTMHYDPKLALAIHAAMMDYSLALKKYYEL